MSTEFLTAIVVSHYDLHPVQKDHNGKKRNHSPFFVLSLVLVRKPKNIVICVFLIYIFCVCLTSLCAVLFNCLSVILN